MPTSPPRRSTPRSPTNTCAASTRRLTRAPGRWRGAHAAARSRPGVVGAAVLCLAIFVLAASCGDEGDGALRTTSPEQTPVPAPGGSGGPFGPPPRTAADPLDHAALARRRGGVRPACAAGGPGRAAVAAAGAWLCRRRPRPPPAPSP